MVEYIGELRALATLLFGSPLDQRRDLLNIANKTLISGFPRHHYRIYGKTLILSRGSPPLPELMLEEPALDPTEMEVGRITIEPHNIMHIWLIEKFVAQLYNHNQDSWRLLLSGVNHGLQCGIGEGEKEKIRHYRIYGNILILCRGASPPDSELVLEGPVPDPTKMEMARFPIEPTFSILKHEAHSNGLQALAKEGDDPAPPGGYCSSSHALRAPSRRSSCLRRGNNAEV